jgi:hypothetical protein
MLRAIIATSVALSLATSTTASAHEPEEEYEEYEDVEADDGDEEVEPAPAASRPDRPPSGVGFLVSGGILTGLGVLNLAASPVCKTELVREDVQNECLIASLATGGVMLAVGIPLLVVGGAKRSKFLEWQEQHPRRRPLPIVSFAPVEGGGLLVLLHSF